MVLLIDGRDVPAGQAQTSCARCGEGSLRRRQRAVRADQRSARRRHTRLIGGIAAFIPIPGLSGFGNFVNAVIRMSLTYVDEIILTT